ncbi:restriction endonuclease subunit R, partial [Candidatus Sumerlaeota bacterium]|nr:restriction endonuclease subunit R [Candidatus Sumerlaeota bacterium]
LMREVAAMNPENFVVRSRRRVVEKYAKPESWRALSDEEFIELREVAGLPSELEAEAEESKRFDLLMLNLQLALLRSEPNYERLRDQVKAIAGLLEEKSSIPMIRDQMPLIQDVQTGEWWQDVTIPMLEKVRRRLRDLVKLIEKANRKPIYTDFEDVMGSEAAIDLPGFGDGNDFAKFRAKTRAFLQEHLEHEVIRKLRMNRPMTAADLAELERLIAGSGAGSAQDLESAKRETQGLGLFVRSLVGLDREAAKGAFAGFLRGKILTANQIEFINMVIDYLTRNGTISPASLYESPFTDITPSGPEGLFVSTQVDELLAVLAEVQATAIAA